MLRAAAVAFALVWTLASAGANAFSSLYVLGDSISDAGNNDLLFKGLVTTPVPIDSNTFIPTFPYQSGRYTNDEVWAQNFAKALGLQANPSLAGGTDFAFGGARTSGGTNPPAFLTIVQQKDDLLATRKPIAPDALYVVQGGANNARDTVAEIDKNKPSNPAPVIQANALDYANDMKSIVADLESAGARDIVVWNVPDLGRAPALLAAGAGASFLGTSVAESMNLALDAAIGKDPHVKLFDVFGVVDNVANHPDQFGLTNVTDACARFTDCDPAKFLFWDGVHPTSAGHEILSDAMLQLIPEPSTYAFAITGLIACLLFGPRGRRAAIFRST
jgi:outer membrane lipase/esterase